MKIAIVYDMIFPFNIGGAEIRNYEIAKRLAKNHEVHLFGVKLWDGPDTLKKDGLIIHGICRYKNLYSFSGTRTVWEPIKFALHLYRPLKKQKFDIIDTSTFVYFHCFTSKLVSVITKTPLVFTWHQYWGDYWYQYLGFLKGTIGKVIEKLVKRLTKNHLAVSRSTKADLISAGVKKDNIIISYNGVDLAKINSIESQKIVYDIIFVGRLIHQKNVSLLIESISLLKKEFSQIKVCIVGDGPDKNKLKKQVERLQLTDNIVFKGFLENSKDVYTSMKSAKLFVLPSLLEGFGMVVMEAFACGLPVVVVKNKWNASQELISSGQDGLISQNNPISLASDIGKILLDEALCKKMGLSASLKAKSFDWSKIVRELEEYYLKVLSW